MQAAFSPPQQGDLKLWLRPDGLSGFSDGDNVNSWSDASGFTTAASNGTAAEQPTYQANATPSGNPAVQFDGTDDQLETPDGDTHAQGTIFYVADVTSGVAWGNADWSHRYFGHIPGNDYFVGNGSFTSAAPSDMGVANDEFGVYTALMGDSSNLSRMFFNGTEPSYNSQSGGDPELGNDFVGRRGNANAPKYLNGSVAELLVYSTRLNATDRETVEQHLVSTHLIPEPASVTLLAPAGLLALRRRRSGG